MNASDLIKTLQNALRGGAVHLCGMQWRAIGVLSDILFGTLYGRFARRTRLGLWRRLLDRLRRTSRCACGDAPEPSAVVIDNRSCRSVPSCFARGVDGGKKVRGVKIQIAVEKYGIPLAIDVAPANQHDAKAIVPVLRELAGGGFQGPALGDLGYRGKRLAEAGQALGITVEPIPSSGYSTGCAGGTLASLVRVRDGQFVPTGICWARLPQVPRPRAGGMADRGSNGPCLAEPLPEVEHFLRALEGAPHRLRCDCLHLHPLSTPEAPRHRGSLRLRSTNKHLPRAKLLDRPDFDRKRGSVAHAVIVHA
jgi:hypothetical protein